MIISIRQPQVLVQLFSILFVTHQWNVKRRGFITHQLINAKTRREIHCFQLQILLFLAPWHKAFSCFYLALFVDHNLRILSVQSSLRSQVTNLRLRFDIYCNQAICKRKTHEKKTFFCRSKVRRNKKLRSSVKDGSGGKNSNRNTEGVRENVLYTIIWRSVFIVLRSGLV